MSQGLVPQPCAEPQGLISTWGHLCHADVVLLFVNPANTTGLVRGLRPPEGLGLISSPCCCTAPAGMHMPSIIQGMERISCCVSQERTAPGAGALPPGSL